MRSERIPVFLLFLLVAMGALPAAAQKTKRNFPERCGTMPRLEARLQANPQLRTRFNFQQRELLRILAGQKTVAAANQRTGAVLTIPVVFHIVMANPSVVTNAQISAQLDTLNRSFFGTNGDSVRIPSYFNSLFGKSGIQFCLAQRTPEGDETTGIVRTTTSTTQFSPNDAMKHISSGGVDSWNTEKYLNIWICQLSGGVLGYGTFPNDGMPAEQGVVIDYRSLPGGSFSSYGAGKTMVHEVGHFFNLYHIWGDDDGLCSGSDQVDDTPNQGTFTSGCHTGIRTDNCTSTGNGIMYQNYMDYSHDQCLVMFTPRQVSRMESTLNVFRSSLLQSDGCQPIARKALDAQMSAILSPSQRLCSPSFTPVISFRNRGTQTLTSVLVRAQIDNGPVSGTSWTGSLVTGASATVTLSNLTTTAGSHVLTVYTTNPNGGTDEEKSNDTIRLAFQYFEPVTTVTESFETTRFPPEAWAIVNQDGSITWQRVTSAAKTGMASVMINNSDYASVGQHDDLLLPQVVLPATLDSAFFSFQVAAAAFTELNTPNNSWDTLEVLVSTNCGQSYTSLYKKWGASLVTRKLPVNDAYVPAAGEWRLDSINLGAYIGQPNLQILFRNTTGYENNIYLDDVNLRTVTINPNLKSSGFLVTPNPTRGQIAVQFYPQPAGLKGIQVLNSTGQKVSELAVNAAQGNTLYQFDLSHHAPGVYMVRAVFADRVVNRKIIKM